MQNTLPRDANEAEARLLSSGKFPSFEGVREMVDELEDLSVTDVTGVHTLLSSDGPLAKEVLRMVNSPLYDLSREISSLREAVLILGITRLRHLALALAYVARFRSEVVYRRGIDFLWQTSLMTAVAARDLAQASTQWDPEEAFLAGLLSDCAVLVMYRLLPGYRDIMERFRLGEGDLIDLERESLPTDHARVSVCFLRVWDLPERLHELLAAQHDPELMGTNADLLERARILKAAWLCARALTIPEYEFEARWLAPRCAELIGVAPASLKGLTKRLAAAFAEAAILFDIPGKLAQAEKP